MDFSTVYKQVYVLIYARYDFVEAAACWNDQKSILLIRNHETTPHPHSLLFSIYPEPLF
jgi:hypothetical protein